MSTGALPIERLVAHRGYQAQYPENSLVGIEAALAAGIVNIECDVQFSGDNVAMLYHDLNLNRVSGLPGTILDYSCAELQKLPAGEPGRLGQQFSDVRIHPLSDLLPLVERYRQARFFIEIKSETLHQIGREAVVAQLRQLFAAHTDRIVMISCQRQSNFDPLGGKVKLTHPRRFIRYCAGLELGLCQRLSYLSVDSCSQRSVQYVHGVAADRARPLLTFGHQRRRLTTGRTASCSSR